MAKQKSAILVFLLMILLVIFILNLLLTMSTDNYIVNKAKTKLEYKNRDFLSLGNSTVVSIEVPAIDSNGRGITTVLTVEVVPGTGRTLVEIENLLFWADTQHSIRVARLVAGNITGKDVNKQDLIYSIEDTNATIIGGPSAGAALTISTIAALEGKKPNKNITITGTINRDGSIGPVSGILEKAKASKEIGAKIFLVPLLQSRDVVYEEVQQCEKYGISELCVTETRPKKVNIKEEVGIDVIEVSNIKEALRYFF